MTTYTTDDQYPEGGNFKPGDICECTNPAYPIKTWVYTGREWVPNSPTVTTNPVTGVIELSVRSASDTQSRFSSVVLWGDSMTYDTESQTSMAVSGYNFSRTNGTTTVTLTAHGLTTGQPVRVTRGNGTIAGQEVADTFSGKFSVTRVDANTFTYSQPGLPDAVGVLASTGVGVKGFVGFPSSTRDRGFFTWANTLLGAPFTLTENLAVNGWRSDQCEAVVDQVIALNPGWVFSQIPGVNDIFGDQSIGGGISYDSAHVITSLTNSLTKFYNAGIKLVLCTITPPRYDNVNNTDVAKLEIYKINAWLKSWALTRENVWLIDAATIVGKSDVTRPSAGFYFSTGANTIATDVTVTATAAVFASTDVGRTIWRDSTFGRCRIKSFTSSTVVVATITQTFSAFPTSAGGAFGSGSWTLASDWIGNDGYNSDSIHYSSRGAYSVGKAIKAALASVITPRPPFVQSISDNIKAQNISPSSNSAIGLNVWPHAPFMATGGTVTAPSTGVAPEGWVVDAAPASTSVASAVVASPFGIGKALQLSCTNAAGSAQTIQCRLSASVFPFQLTPNATYVVEVQFSMTGDLVGKGFWGEFNITLDGVGHNPGGMNLGVAASEVEAVPDVWSGMLRSQPIYIASGSSISSGSIYLKLKLWNNTTVPVVLTVGSFSIKRIS